MARKSVEPKGPKITSTALQKFDIPITRETLRQTLEEAIQRSLNLPSDQAIADLWTPLFGIRAWCRIHTETFRPTWRRHVEIRAAIRAIAAHMPESMASTAKFEKDLQEGLAALDISVGPEANLANGIIAKLADARAKMKALNSIIDAASIIEQHADEWFSAPENPVFEDRWPQHLRQIVQSYRTAMRPANPNDDLKIHVRGPGGRFVSAVIPYLTGESPTAGAVGKAWENVKGEND